FSIPGKQAVSVTPAAEAQIARLMAAGDKKGLRIGVKKGGCAGMEYTMDWAQTQDKFDEVVEHNGVKVLIEPTAVMYLLGTEMDYEVDKLSSGFVFKNPNQQSACGCGESVNLVPAAAADAGAAAKS
ncbi:MAG: iron-sulfur cluster assembly accessory protein, partial [Pseudomonadota bacterium]